MTVMHSTRRWNSLMALVVASCAATAIAASTAWRVQQRPAASPPAGRPPDLMPVRDEIVKRVVEQSQVPNHAVARTTLDAVTLLASCDQTESNAFRISTTLAMYGTMWLPRRVTRVPKDPSVVDTASARAHEYGWHLDPAARSVHQLVQGEAAVTYPTRKECHARLRALQDRAADTFIAEARRTQFEEDRARRPKSR